MDLGFITELDAEAIGEPGHRVFRVRARKGGETASLWLEKQQLQALSLALRQVLEQARAHPHGDVAPAVPFPDFPETPSLDLQVGRLALGWDERSQRTVLQAFEAETPEDAAPAFACVTSAERALAFCELADTVCAAGRPICFLCREPINPGGHTCVRANGHRGEALPPVDEKEE